MARPKHRLEGTEKAITQLDDATEVIHDSITARNQRESRLLQMPAEIRNSIFNYALGGNVFDISTPYLPVDFQTGLPKHSLALPRTCRQIHAETSLLAFATNTFYIDTWYTNGGKALTFLAGRSCAELRSIQSCFICVGSETVAFKALKMMSNVRTIQMTNIFHYLVSLNPASIIVLYEQDSSILYPEVHLKRMMNMLNSWNPEVNVTMKAVEGLQGDISWSGSHRQ